MAAGTFRAASVLVVLVLSATALGLSIAAYHRATHHTVAPSPPAPTPITPTPLPAPTPPAPTPLPTGVPIITYQVIGGLCSLDPVQFGVPDLLFQGILVVAGTVTPVPHKPITYTVTGATPSSGNMNTNVNGIFSIFGTPTAAFGNQVFLTYHYPANSVGAIQNGNCTRIVVPPPVFPFTYDISPRTAINVAVNSSAITGTALRGDTLAPVAGLSIAYTLFGNAGCSLASADPVVTNNVGMFQVYVICANAGSFRVTLLLPDDSTFASTTSSPYNINVI